MTQLEVTIHANEAVGDEAISKQKREVDRIIKAHKKNVSFTFSKEPNKPLERGGIWMDVVDTEGGIFGSSEKRRTRVKSSSPITAEEIESTILNYDDSIEPELEDEESADYCTHCRADLRDYPNPTYCPECGRRPKPP